ncbi:hypothetical protein ACFE04_028092 [Oxalis oulophora]
MPQDSSSEPEPDDGDPEFVEVDPSGRYGRYKEMLGSGSFKKVYRAFDEWEGIEVAWNQVKVSSLLRNSDDFDRLFSEVHLLKTLKHKNIIKFYTSWVDSKHEYINFITEIFTSGTLRQYRNKHKNVNLRAIKKWSRQILEGLSYLHSQDPPVIHRDLKCDNIFVNGNHGEVKIADLGLAAILCKAPASHSCIGTPEFMAPELYKEEYNELVDIYAFGMCLLELVTLEYPYAECDNAIHIYKKVVSGIKPKSLGKVQDPELKAFIEKCITNVSDRLSAKELLKDIFLQPHKDHVIEGLSMESNQLQSANGPEKINGYKKAKNSSAEPEKNVALENHQKDMEIIFLKLQLVYSSGESRLILFPFYIGADTAISVASEMATELNLSNQDVPTIASMIDSDIQSHIPEWRPSDVCADNYAHETKVESSPCVNDLSSFSSRGLALERLPSGRKYWSETPKEFVESSSGVLEFSNLTKCMDSIIERECKTKDDKSVNIDNVNGSASSKIPRNTEAEEIKTISEKLESLMAKQQKEVDELKRRHEVSISEFLKEYPPEICQKVLNLCKPKIVGRGET